MGEEVAEWLAPVRARYLELREDTAAIEEFLAAGAEKAQAIAAPVVADVRERMGVGPSFARVRPPGGLGSPRCASPSSSWTSTSSRGPSTCCSR